MKSAPEGFTPNPRAVLYKRAGVKDGYLIGDPPAHWVALGDSFTAAPGAGDRPSDKKSDTDCYRTKGSWAFQLNEAYPFDNAKEFQFIACTGYKMTSTRDLTIPLINDEEPDFMAMTIGGNDIFFAEIIANCIVRELGSEEKCDNTIDKARNMLNSNEFKDNLVDLYFRLFGKMKADYRTQLYQLTYPRFFDATTDWCDDQTMGRGIIADRPKLTKELRATLNKLSDDANARIIEIARVWQNERIAPPQRGGQQPFPTKGWWEGLQRLFLLDLDRQKHEVNQEIYGLFDGHRFCEQGVEDPKFQDDRIWFFGPPDVPVPPSTHGLTAQSVSSYDAKACQKDSKYTSGSQFKYECDWAVYFASSNATKTLVAPLYEAVAKTLHPKPAGYEIMARLMRNVLPKERPVRSGALCAVEEKPKEIEVTLVGDTVEPVQATSCVVNVQSASGTAVASGADASASKYLEVIFQTDECG